jgi:small subunit ribosomal protein S14
MSRDRSKIKESEIKKLCESLLQHRSEVRNQLDDLTDESANQLQSEAESFDLTHYEEVELEESDDDDEGIRETATVEVTGGGGHNHGGAVVKTGGASGTSTGGSAKRGRPVNECQYCGREQGLVGKYDIYLCRQCFRELAGSMGFVKYC